MDADTALILGMLIVGFSIPSMVSAMSDGRAPGPRSSPFSSPVA